MLDENDIKKLIEAQKEVFATKKDLTGLKEIFVTKEEFEGLIDIVATKEELNEVGKDVKEIKSLLIDFGSRTKNLEIKVDYIETVLNLPVKKS
jgi:hypothetical protein